MRREGTDRHWLHGLGLIPGVVIKKEEPLAPYTFMKVGGPAECLLDVENRAALAQALGVLDRYATPFYLLGRGSNLLVSDHGVRGAVVRLVGEFKQVEWREQESCWRRWAFPTLAVG